jgi:hypothetical protein
LDSGKALWDSCNDPDASKQSYCLGYVAGMSDVLAGMHIICIGERVSVRQIADIVVQYLREHPGRRDMDADDLASCAGVSLQVSDGPPVSSCKITTDRH